MKVGIIGGTFDPIHNGHMTIAEETRVRLSLAKVVFVPAGLQWLKEDVHISAAEQRLQMVRLAIADRPYFKLSTVDTDRQGPTHTVDTITELQFQLGVKAELFFILGWDSLAELPKWHEPSRLIRICRLVAVPRPGHSAPDLKSLEAAIPGISQRVILLDSPRMDTSATAIRLRVAQGLSIGHLVPEPVERYISEHKLYITI